jgi:hypothetical protein
MDGKVGCMALGCLSLWGPADEAEAWSIVLWLGLTFLLLVSTDVHSLQRYSYSDDLGLLVDTTSEQGLDSSSTDANLPYYWQPMSYEQN